MAKNKKISPNQTLPLSHQFIEAEYDCCKDFFIPNISKNSQIDELILKLASNKEKFEDLSHPEILSWNSHYRCNGCRIIWELSPPANGQAGYFRPLQSGSPLT